MFLFLLLHFSLSLEKALKSLDRALLRSQKEPQDEEVRDSVIQRFEFTYELCWKMLRRRLEADDPSPETIRAMNFKTLIRIGAERGLISNPESWFEYRRKRNITTHTYDESKAVEVHRNAYAFYRDALELYHALILNSESEDAS